MSNLIVIQIPLKKPYEVDIAKPLKNVFSVITSTSNKTQDFTTKINEFSKLRTTALWKAYERRDGALEELYTYFDQLDVLEKKIPAGELQIPFKWRCAFCKGLFSKQTLTIPSIGFEKACVLFNIAALQSSRNVTLCADNDESLKRAAKVFQQSAGIFDYLKNNVMTTIQREPTPDLHPDTLATLACFMLAQAQEVFVHKSRSGSTKNETIARVSSEASSLYGDVLNAMQQQHIAFLWDKESISIASGKQALFRGVAEYHQSIVCRERNAVGEQIARLKVAIEFLKSALKFSNKLKVANDLILKAEKMLKDSIRENECIFHDIIPDSSSLSSIDRISLVSPQPLPQKFSNEFQDLFVELVPEAVQRVLVLFETRKQEQVQSEVYKLREATQLLNGILASLNLPAAIEDTVEQEVPQSLLTKSTTVWSYGGSETLERRLNRLPDLQSCNTEILEEIEKMLNDEEQSDETLRKKYKEKWTRKSSSSLTSSFRSNLEKYRHAIHIAIHADTSLRSKFEDHKINMELLGHGPKAVAKAVPQATFKQANKDTQSVSRLKQLMKQVENIKKERDSIEYELTSANSNIKETALSALDKGNLNEEALLEDVLKRVFNPIKFKILQSFTAQENVIEDIQKANKQFTLEREAENIVSQERDRIFKNLAVAYDVFMVLSNNLDEGTKFYNDMTEVLLTLQSKVADFCFARRTEKDELLKDIDKGFKLQGTASKQHRPSENTLSTNKTHRDLGATAGSSTRPDLPYPIIPQNMPLPYGPYIQLPYPQCIMPALPHYYTAPSYFTMPLPTEYKSTPQDSEHLDNIQKPSTS